MIEILSDSAKVQAVLDRVRATSEAQLKLLREVARNVISDENIIVGVNGSIARREATSGSDVDLFVLYSSGEFYSASASQQLYRCALKDRGIPMPAEGGVFEKALHSDELITNIGGEDDTNTFITRRMLYLLEGEWVANQKGFEALRAELISRYVSDDLGYRKFCRYLLNDIIRYWRTICVDFEFKTAAASKPRAIRLVKLRLSRMMLYFAGVAAISQTVEMDVPAKRETLARLLAEPPVTRLVTVYGREATAGALAAYATFLEAIDQKAVRERLSARDAEGLDTDEYRELIEVARKFRLELEGLLIGSDGKVNEIASALLL